MPPQQASQCCRSIRRQITTPRDNVWITDSLLASSFERYCRISLEARRRASNVPGPLESRRRLGKRQMGDLQSIQSSPSLPAWAFPTPLDMSQWQWQPPTLPAARASSYQQPQPSTRPAVSLPAWLGGWTGQEAQDMIDSQNSYGLAVVEELTKHTPTFLRDFESFRPLLSTAPTEALLPQFQAICQQFQQNLVSGLVTSQELEYMFTVAVEALDARFQEPARGQSLYMTLFSAITNGLASSRVLSPQDLGSYFWKDFMLRMAQVPADESTFAIFESVMSRLPPDYFPEMYDGVVSMVDALLASWAEKDRWEPAAISRFSDQADNASQRLGSHIQAAREHLRLGEIAAANALVRNAKEADAACRAAINSASDAFSSHGMQIQALSRSLAKLNADDQDQLLQSTAKLILRYPFTPEMQHQIRYYWLSVMAQMARINQDSLFEAAARLLGSLGADHALSGAEIGFLLIHQWQSRGYLKYPIGVRSLFERLSASNPPAGVASLAMAIWLRQKHSQCFGLISSLCKFLRKLGRLEELVESFEALGVVRRVPLRLLEMVARASDDHRLALRLHRLYMEKLGGGESGGPQWNPGEWRNFVDRIIMDSTINPGEMWYALGVEMGNMTSRQRFPHRSSRIMCAQKGAVVESMAVRLAHAAHLRERIAFRHVSQCVNLLARHDTGLRPAVLQALYLVISRQLKDGLPGVTARLRWFLRVIERNYGHEVARQCALALGHWRVAVRRSSALDNLDKQQG